MSEHVQIELAGENAVVWDRVFTTFSDVIAKAMDALTSDLSDETRESAKQTTHDLATLVGTWVKAKAEDPKLKNDKVIAEISLLYQQVEAARAKTRREQIEGDIRAVELEQKRLDLWQQRLTLAIKWLGVLEVHTVCREDGSRVLLLTNDTLPVLLADLRSMSQLNTREDS